MKRQRHPCHHCQKRLSDPKRGRGLCRRCHEQPHIRSLYPRAGRINYGNQYSKSPVDQEIADFNAAAPLPSVPCTALPGTPAKLLVFAARAQASVQLFSPQDAQWQDHPDPVSPADLLTKRPRR